MKKWLPILVLVAGLGSSFSFTQVEPSGRIRDPLERSIESIRSNIPEPSLKEFAQSCAVEILPPSLKFAKNLGKGWLPASDLVIEPPKSSKELSFLAAVWSKNDWTLLEIWSYSNDLHSEVNTYSCYSNLKVQRVESIEWDWARDKNSGRTDWAHTRWWERDPDGRMKQVRSEFIDKFGQPTPKPASHNARSMFLDWTPTFAPLNELKLPPSLLR
jgi:hypothetical protein